MDVRRWRVECCRMESLYRIRRDSFVTLSDVVEEEEVDG